MVLQPVAANINTVAASTGAIARVASTARRPVEPRPLVIDARANQE
jgi:hypothetical protein